MVCFDFHRDVKADNDPERLFETMRDIIMQYPDWRSDLAPRLILGLWHPKFIEPAKRILPYCTRIHIGFSTSLARKFFWKECEGFSINFASLVGSDGEAFRRECKAAGKKLYVWTVNARTEMIEATKWGVQAVLTDRTADYLALRASMKADWDAVCKETTPLFAFSSPTYYAFVNKLYSSYWTFILTRQAGPMNAQ